MTVRNLEATLAPESLALIGATSREGAVGRVVLDNVRATFGGRVFPVNLKYDELFGLRCYRTIADLPEAPDIAIVMTPGPTVPGIVSELGRKGTKVAVVVSAGVTGALRQAMLDAARPHLLRIIGPNTIGLLAPHAGLNASFVHLPPLPGRLGLISQSGAMVSSIVDWAASEGIGFSHIYSLGDMADVDVGDCLNVLAADPRTSAILMYLESIPAPRKFMSAARAIARIKPVIAVKPGRHAEAAKAAATHTGALAGADRVVEAALRRAGIIRVEDLADLFDAAEITGRYAPMRQARVAIVTNGGGAGVLAVDKLIDHHVPLATLTPETMAALDRALPSTWSRANPIDIIGDAPPERYRAAVRAAALDPNVDALLVMNCPTALADPSAAAAAVAAETNRGLINGKPVLATWLGRKTAEPAAELLRAAGIGTFRAPAEAAQAVSLLTRWSLLRDEMQRVPAERGLLSTDKDAARDLLHDAAAEGRSLLTEDEAKHVLAAYGVAVPQTIFASDPAAVEQAAATLLAAAQAVVVKVRSKHISHKSDIGGVILNLRTATEARDAAAAITSRLRANPAPLPFEGFTVQPMIQRPNAEELIVGVSTDPQFGPVALFGAGGTSVEVVADTATGLVPLDEVLAGDLIDKTRISRLLAGYRDRPPADRDAIVAALMAVSQLAIDFPMVQSIDINPLLADRDGVIALDARIAIDPGRASVPAPNPALAIRPYPAEEFSIVHFLDRKVLLRPIKPSDAELYPSFLSKMDPEDMRLRFLVPMRTLSHETLVLLTQLDYDRDIAFVALANNGTELLGMVRYSSDPDGIRAEFGALVRSDLKGHGLGRSMMEMLIDYARRQGLHELFGRVLRENTSMLALCHELGFVEAADDEARLLRVTLPLRS
jgi:acetyltransferase